MTNTDRFAPLKEELANIRIQVNKALEETFVGGTNSLPLDISETDESIVVESGALLGLDMESLDIEINDGNQLTIAGKTTNPASGNVNYLRQERKFGTFSRTVGIPTAIIATEAKAHYKGNVLTIVLPKATQSTPKVVKVTPLE